ncbi:hypothetical protein D7B24_006383 [Verticillium nonalfalfae]|uniref:Uncharacterized protein n=1 Tax=Verticillium nonalfalfae TaxID=1051616 RepID=A0A3M9YC29_9PEZI|nr:uncharacterized protein D7B24_006383 [Verticillium nonalfalfae]RNJ57108.1 hypothetical protein D7B24_006383 [Verticillium nonalfalfae]
MAGRRRMTDRQTGPASARRTTGRGRPVPHHVAITSHATKPPATGRMSESHVNEDEDREP